MNLQFFLFFVLAALSGCSGLTSIFFRVDGQYISPEILAPSVFISYRFAEAKTVAVNLKSALIERGVTGIVIDANPGDSSILDTVVRAIDESVLFVVLGT